MGKSLHKNWDGFIQIRNAEMKIIAAKCKRCNKELKKRDSEALSVHKRMCRRLHNVAEENENPKNAKNLNPKFAEESIIGKYAELNSPESSNNELSVLKKNVSAEDKNVLLLKFFLACEIDFDKVSSVHCVNLFRCFDPTYELPSREELRDKVLPLAKDRMLKYNDSYDFLSFLCILSHEAQAEIFIISLAVNSKNKYIYIDFDSIKKDDKTIYKLESFCDQSVKKVREIYKVKIEYLIYDGQYFLNSVGKINETTYFRICCLTVLIDNLKNNHEPFIINNKGDVEVMQEYYNELDKLRNKFTVAGYSLAEACEDTLQFVNKNCTTLNVSITRIVLKYLSPVALTSNFLHYKYRGHLFGQYPSLMNLVSEFLEQSLPCDAFEAVADYKNKSGEFKHLCSSDLDHERFWCIAKMHYKSLSDFALILMTLPATLRKINMQRVIKMQKETSLEIKDSVRDLFFSIILDDAN